MEFYGFSIKEKPRIVALGIKHKSIPAISSLLPLLRKTPTCQNKWFFYDFPTTIPNSMY